MNIPHPSVETLLRDHGARPMSDPQPTSEQVIRRALHQWCGINLVGLTEGGVDELANVVQQALDERFLGPRLSRDEMAETRSRKALVGEPLRRLWAHLDATYDTIRNQNAEMGRLFLEAERLTRELREQDPEGDGAE